MLDLVYDPDGFVYATTGQIVDVRNTSNPLPAGTLPTRGAVRPLPGSNLALMVSGVDSAGSGSARLRLYDASTLGELDALPLSIGQNVVRARDLVYLASGPVAFIGDTARSSSLYLRNGYELP